MLGLLIFVAAMLLLVLFSIQHIHDHLMYLEDLIDPDQTGEGWKRKGNVYYRGDGMDVSEKDGITSFRSKDKKDE